QKDGGALIALAVVGVVAPWLSYPSVFALAGVGSMLLFHAWIGQRRRDLMILLAASALWIVSFASEYWRSIGNQSYLASGTHAGPLGQTSLLKDLSVTLTYSVAMRRSLVPRR